MVKEFCWAESLGFHRQRLRLSGREQLALMLPKRLWGWELGSELLMKRFIKLRRIEKELGINVYTSVAQGNYIREAVMASDVVIGAAYREGQRAPMVITEDMVKEMREGSVIIDVAIDQGGCVETSRPTTHDQPTFIKHGVIHYCVPNIASRVARTASIAISNVLGPLLVNLGDNGGIDNYVRFNDGLKQGIYIYRRHLTKKKYC